ncbi:hypothetical protein B0H10DRAFT_62450 [Mycena sp. CBHHK59/15]|nr:hypothetical protein B0H10DRAFT_62450 [Mycena sp. CBHHK59/15]
MRSAYIRKHSMTYAALCAHINPHVKPSRLNYGVWLVSLFLETILYGMGALQAWLYFQWCSGDPWTIKLTVLSVVISETIQVVFFFRSSYFRFVERFGFIQTDLTLADSVQLLANYISGFIVQIFFASRIYYLMKGRVKNKVAIFGIYLIGILALTQIMPAAAGIAQTIITHELRSFLKLGQTKAITTLQTASSLACDILITGYLGGFLIRSKNGMPTTNSILNMLIIEAVSRGFLTAVCSGLTTVLFLATPGTFYFFIGLALSSKLYLNSMLASLNSRQHILDKAYASKSQWTSLPAGHTPVEGRTTNSKRRGSVSAVNFESISMDTLAYGKKADLQIMVDVQTEVR